MTFQQVETSTPARSCFAICACRRCSPRTWWSSDEGLLPPSGRSASGYRLYGEEDLARVERIRALRDAGLDLATIRSVLAGATPLREALRGRLLRVEAEIAGLRQVAAALRASLRSAPDEEDLRRLRGQPAQAGPSAEWSWLIEASRAHLERRAPRAIVGARRSPSAPGSARSRPRPCSTLAPPSAASTARALGSGSFRPPSRVWSGRPSRLPSSLTARHDDRALQVSRTSARTDHRPHRDLDPRRGDLMPPTRPTLVDSTPRFGRSASSRGAAPALLLVLAGASAVQGGIGRSPAPALQARFGPGQITRHGSF
ncbi:MerR family transcriptional regulator [Sorangium sp. So ce1389]|uniref:helix-turn-helix domain-containing protein n=1 Tax=Sorangium sp. So ce1389 TaxID=3133336 RepID=UPI003F60CB1D